MRQVFGLVVFFVGILLSLSSFSVTPTSEQIRMLQALPESERQALIGRYSKSTSLKQIPETEVETVKPLERKLRGQESKTIEQSPFVDKAFVEGVNAAKTRSEFDLLEPFGAFLFAGQPTTFSPVNNIPVPTDYILGPGDQLKVYLFGTKNESYELVIDRNGQISIPSLEPLTLAGMGFSEAKSFLASKIQSLGFGVNASVTMGELRSFRIFVLGESRTPGSYLVSGMATITHALYVSGGLTNIASYRNVQLKRQGRLIQTLDLYDLLLKGDTSADQRLQPGDTVFIPKSSQRVAVIGEVLKPAWYEIKHEKNLQDLVALAGGLTSNAYQKSIQLSRIITPEVRQTFSIDLTQKQGKQSLVKLGDRILIPSVSASMNNLVNLTGEVSRAGLLAWQPNIKLLDLLPNRNHFTNQADTSLILIKRQGEVAGSYDVLKSNWSQAVSDPSSSENISLLPRDEVIVLPKNDSEQRKIKIDQLLALVLQQGSQKQPTKRVSIRGAVKYPGAYPLIHAMRVLDLVQMSGDFAPSAMLNQAEIIRYNVVDGQRREVEAIRIDLNQVLAGEVTHNILLKPFDALIVKKVSDWSDASETVTIKGEVAHPGSYIIMPGDTLESLLLRAGGFTQWAAPENTVFTREALKALERREMDMMADELEKGLLFSLKTGNGGDIDSTSIVTLGQGLIDKVKDTPALGRLVIGLNPEKEARYHASLQLELRDGDELIIPKRSNEIVVMGEVSRPASLLFQDNLTMEDYLQQSGGMTKRADTDGVYVVRGDGSIVQYKKTFFGHSDALALRPGDAIIVPMDIERISPMFTWTAVTKILSNLSITAAALQTIGVFK